MDNGYIKLHRKLLEDPIFQKPELLQLFIYCLLKANHKENEFIFNKELIKVQRGSFITGREQMVKDVKQTESATYKRLKLLENFNYISLKSNNKFTLLTIVKYETYQDNRKEKEQQSNNKVTTKEQQSNTNNNDNNDKNEKKLSFENFWNLYDKKAEREICEKKWNKLTDEERTLIMDYLPKYKISTPDKQYRKNPQTFLNKKSWNDEIIKSEKSITNLTLEQTAENLITQYGERFYKVRNNFKSPVEDEFNINTSNYYDMKFSLSNKLPNENNYKDSPELLSLLEKKLRKKFLELEK